jgi:hypothetical protein
MCELAQMINGVPEVSNEVLESFMQMALASEARCSRTNHSILNRTIVQKILEMTKGCHFVIEYKGEKILELLRAS